MSALAERTNDDLMTANTIGAFRWNVIYHTTLDTLNWFRPRAWIARLGPS